MSNCRMAIIGGGLAGLATANALNTYGIKAEVFEAAPELREIGAAVNAIRKRSRLCKRLGLAIKLQPWGTDLLEFIRATCRRGNFWNLAIA